MLLSFSPGLSWEATANNLGFPAHDDLGDAAGLAPTDPLESGLAATLSPGPYTALLAGSNNGTGVGVVEVYDLSAP